LAYHEKVRVFIAVDIDDPLLLSKLERLKDTIVASGVPMKPVETSNIHMTIRFIGEISKSKVEEIIEHVLRPIKEKSFKIVIKGLGAFPSINRPRVIWVGVDQGAEKLVEIRNRIESSLIKLGFSREKPEFIPHITLARIKGARNLPMLVRILNEYRDVEIGEMIVNSIRLKKSTLTRSGPIYETLWEVRFT
jgi:2'-5' RNA ligase